LAIANTFEAVAREWLGPGCINAASVVQKAHNLCGVRSDSEHILDVVGALLSINRGFVGEFSDGMGIAHS
jgi:hypothetical protein